ncbi:MAG: DNA-protecting protein DprA [Ignavibacteriae bacterium]|nr:DNA-protecting protein DprA [Ignavibacteriota bacterium]
MNIDLRELLTLSLIPGVGSTRLISLISHFKDTALVLKASAKELVHVENIEKKTALSIVNFLRDSGADQAKRYIDDQFSRLNKCGARIISYWEKEYPPNLKNIFDAPAYLFVKGKILEADRYSVAVVGTRSASPYGTQMAEKISSELATLGITTVSGLARGIDTTAHSATLKSGGRTLAVIGSGIDIMYPAENLELAERIIRNGALISEFPMSTKPDATNFPRRNRIISGISLGTIVVETGVEGGAMITATLAFDQNREVFAVPASVQAKKRSGTNLLIKQEKAALVEDVEDVTAILAPQLKHLVRLAGATQRMPLPELTIFEQKLCDAMGDDPMHIDPLAEKAGFSTADALVHLLSLEFKGVVKQTPGKMFRKIG